MINNVIRRSIDLDSELHKDVLHTIFVTEDDMAHTFEISVNRGGVPVDLSDITVTGSFVRYKDNGTITVQDGQTSGNVASITLSKSCYGLSGMFCFFVHLNEGDARTTIYAGEGTLLRSRTDVLYDDTNVIPSLEDLLELIASMDEAEQSREAAESLREESELERVASEAVREENEDARLLAEDAREAAETGREVAEFDRDEDEAARQAAELVREANETARQSAEDTRETNETARENAESQRVTNETARNTKLGNLDFSVEMLPPSETAYAETTQDADSIDVKLFVPKSNLTYATFHIDKNNHLIMTTPDDYEGVNFVINPQNGHLEVEINA